MTELQTHELIFLGNALSNRLASLDLVDLLNDGYQFSNEDLRKVAAITADMWIEFDDSGSAMFLNQLELRDKIAAQITGGEYLIQQLTDSAVQDWSYSYDALKNHNRVLKMKHSLSGIEKLDDPDKILEKINGTLNASSSYKRENITATLLRLKERFAPYSSGEMERLSTGMEFVDKCLDGGINPDAIVILGAYAGTGKTHLLVQMANAAIADGRDVIFVSNEMSEEEIIIRMIAQAAKVSEKAVYQNDDHNKRFWRAADAMQESMEDHLKVAYINVIEDAISYLKNTVRNMTNPIIFIDYLQWFESKTRFHDDRLKIEHICSQLGNFAKTTTVPLVIAAQITKSAKDDDYTDSFMGSSAIMRLASVGLVMKRAAIEFKDKRQYAKLQVIKGRQGERGTAYGYYQFPDARFVDTKTSLVKDEWFEERISFKGEAS
jgi:archaellum biogenesis ATPase FlaH